MKAGVAVVDLGCGNTASMLFALERLGVRAHLTRDPAAIGEAERLVLPGVGHAAHAAARIGELGLAEVLRGFPRPLLGVCLGMQLLYSQSEEGDAPGLGILPGRVARLEPAPDRPVPHMGWNALRPVSEHALLDGLTEDAHVYFVHSYAAPVNGVTVAAADYGEPFTAIAASGPAMGCQFHPERSGPAGARILRNFVELPC